MFPEGPKNDDVAYAESVLGHCGTAFCPVQWDEWT